MTERDKSDLWWQLGVLTLLAFCCLPIWWAAGFWFAFWAFLAMTAFWIGIQLMFAFALVAACAGLPSAVKGRSKPVD